MRKLLFGSSKSHNSCLIPKIGISSIVLAVIGLALPGKVVAGTVPGVPTDVHEASHTSTSVTIQWSAPTDAGGEPISDYVVQYKSPTGEWTTFPDGTSVATYATVTGLTRGTPYNFRVAASNVNGTGAFAPLDPLGGISLGRHSCGITSQRKVVCWGLNTVGQLGVPPSEARYQQLEVPGLSDVTQLEVGLNHSCAVLSNGTVKCWGANESGQLGNGTTATWSTPVLVSGLTGVTRVTSGFKFSCALKSNKSVLCWGMNDKRQLGNSQSTATSTTPVQVASISGATFVDAGRDHACALLDSQSVKCWGDTYEGFILYPGGSTALVRIRQISLNPENMSGCAVGDVLFCWGYGYGQSRNSRQIVGISENVTSVSVGSAHTVAIASGRVRSWTEAENYSVSCWRWGGGCNSIVGSMGVPVSTVDTVVSGYMSSCAGTANNFYCWGDNNLGQQAAPMSLDDTSDVRDMTEFVSARRATPVGLAGSPTNLAETHEATAVTLMWAAPIETGSMPIYDYLVEYRTSGSNSWRTFDDGLNSQSGAVVNGLAKGSQYDFRVSAVTQEGTGFASNAISAYAASNPGAVTALTSPSHDETSVSLTWAQPEDNGGRSVVDYFVEYKTVSASTWRLFSDGVSTETKARVTGLTRSTSYNFRITVQTANGLSSPVQLASAVTAATIPSAPTLRSVSRPVSGSTLSIDYSINDNGGLPINGLQYRLDGGPWASGDCCTSRLVIPGLTNGVRYSVEVRLGNSDGFSAPSSPVVGTPAAMPAAPTIDSVAKPIGGGELSVAFTSGSDNGAPIGTYEYSVNGGSTWFVRSDGGSVLSPLRISALTNGTTYQLKIRAVNAQGSGAPSNAVSAFPATTPGTPAISRLESASSSLGVVFTAPAFNGGSAVINYEYSLDGGVSWTARSPAGVSSPWTISGLVDGTLYSVQLRAVNSQGPGSISAVSSGTPASLPSSPSIAAIEAPAAGRSLWVHFSAPSSDGGSAIVTYQYSINGGTSWLSRTDGQTTTSPLKISGLTNGTSYGVSIRALNARGAGSSSPVEVNVPAGKPSAPTISSIDAPTTGEALLVYFVAGNSQGSDVFDYQYSIDGGRNWFYRSDGDTTESPLVIEGLTNGDEYRVSIRSENSQGIGDASVVMTASPATTPARPSIESMIVGNGTLTVKVAQGDDGGAPILLYQVSIDGGDNWKSWVATSRSRILSGLKMGSEYRVVVRSINAQGASPSSTPSNVRLGNEPTVVAEGAQDVGQSSVRLTASVNANFVSTEVRFEISDKSDFTSVLRKVNGRSLDSGVSTSVSVDVADLPEDTTLFYRVFAENQLGRASSETLTFRTFTPVGVSIEDGATYANSVNVDVFLSWPRGSIAVILSNDGSFKSSSRFSLASSVPWKLQTSGAERLTKVVYAKFVLSNGSRSSVYQDDIVLDETEPVLSDIRVSNESKEGVALAAAGGSSLRISASDSQSGIERFELKRFPEGTLTVVASTNPFGGTHLLDVVNSSPQIAIRAVDHAGNSSPWVRVSMKTGPLGVSGVLASSPGRFETTKTVLAAVGLSKSSGIQIKLSVSSETRALCRIAGSGVRTLKPGTCVVKVLATGGIKPIERTLRIRVST